MFMILKLSIIRCVLFKERFVYLRVCGGVCVCTHAFRCPQRQEGYEIHLEPDLQIFHLPHVGAGS